MCFSSYQEWFHKNCTRQLAEALLSTAPTVEGAFLVRPSDRVTGAFCISFTAAGEPAAGKFKHCLLKQDGRLFVVGTEEFESLIDLVNHYQKRPLYKKVRRGAYGQMPQIDAHPYFQKKKCILHAHRGQEGSGLYNF